MVTIETFGGAKPLVSKKKGARRSAAISRPGEGPTTGLILTADGYIVTSTFNFIQLDFLKDPKRRIITVTLPSGEQKVARFLGRDETRKICLLKVDDVSDLPVPAMAPRDEFRVGQWAVSVGVGFGDDDPALSAGIVSATQRISGRAVQTDANISPANYGGPLVDIQGRVIGICVPLSPRSQDAAAGSEWYDSGIGFAVPLDGQSRLIELMKAGKVVQPGMMGVQVRPADKETGQGVVIAKVLEKTPADKAGLKEGDQIVAVDGQEPLDPAQLRILLGRHIAGDTVKIAVTRGKERIEATVELAAGVDKTPSPRRLVPRKNLLPPEPADPKKNP
jgi:serine protease Do